jgi:hypothetical protein
VFPFQFHIEHVIIMLYSHSVDFQSIWVLHTSIIVLQNRLYLQDFPVHATFMVTSFNISWKVSFPKKYDDFVKTYHSYIRIVTQTCLAKYRKLLKKKERWWNILKQSIKIITCRIQEEEEKLLRKSIEFTNTLSSSH